MFGFGKKLSLEEKQQWDSQIKALFEKEDFDAAYKKAKEYEKLDKVAAAYYLARLYFLGKGVKQQDLDKALLYISKYTEKYPEDRDAWFYGSDIMVANNKPEEAIEYLMKAETLGKEEATKCLATFCSYMGLAYRNAAWVTMKVPEYKALNAKAILCFTRAIQKYRKLYEQDPAIMQEDAWMQLGFVVHYMHFLALSNAWPNMLYKDDTVGPDIEKAYQMPDRKTHERTSEYWKEVAEKVISDMEKEGFLVHGAYVKAMLASNEADLNKSEEHLALAKQYLDQACELAGERVDYYKEEYEVVWNEYERLVRKFEKTTEKKRLFSKK